MKKIYIISGLIACFLVGGIVGYELHSQPKEIKAGAASPTGTQQEEPQLAQYSASPLTGAIASTSASIFNNSYDRAITDGYAFCTGVGSQPAAQTFSMFAATSSAATTSNTTYAINGLNIATTSAIAYAATSTWSSDALRLWPAGTFLDFSFNATDTAACTFGVHYVAL